jgi:hypothetical protein
MHTIDLLRGEGVPAKATAGTVAIVIVTVLVPLLAGAVMADRYLNNRENIAIQQEAIARNQVTIDELAWDVEWKNDKLKEQGLITKKLSEVATCVDDYIQWTPVLLALVENMPRDMIMSRLAASSKVERQQAPSPTDPNNMININITRRSLAVDVTGTEQRNYGSIVQKYTEDLKKSPRLAQILQDINVSQKRVGSIDEETATWTMNLIFKSQS